MNMRARDQKTIEQSNQDNSAITATYEEKVSPLDHDNAHAQPQYDETNTSNMNHGFDDQGQNNHGNDDWGNNNIGNNNIGNNDHGNDNRGDNDWGNDNHGDDDWGNDITGNHIHEPGFGPSSAHSGSGSDHPGSGSDHSNGGHGSHPHSEGHHHHHHHHSASHGGGSNHNGNNTPSSGDNNIGFDDHGNDNQGNHDWGNNNIGNNDHGNDNRGNNDWGNDDHGDDDWGDDIDGNHIHEPGFGPSSAHPGSGSDHPGSGSDHSGSGSNPSGGGSDHHAGHHAHHPAHHLANEGYGDQGYGNLGNNNIGDNNRGNNNLGNNNHGNDNRGDDDWGNDNRGDDDWGNDITGNHIHEPGFGPSSAHSGSGSDHPGSGSDHSGGGSDHHAGHHAHHPAHHPANDGYGNQGYGNLGDNNIGNNNRGNNNQGNNNQGNDNRGNNDWGNDNHGNDDWGNDITGNHTHEPGFGPSSAHSGSGSNHPGGSGSDHSGAGSDHHANGGGSDHGGNNTPHSYNVTKQQVADAYNQYVQANTTAISDDQKIVNDAKSYQQGHATQDRIFYDEGGYDHDMNEAEIRDIHYQNLQSEYRAEQVSSPKTSTSTTLRHDVRDDLNTSSLSDLMNNVRLNDKAVAAENSTATTSDSQGSLNVKPDVLNSHVISSGADQGLSAYEEDMHSHLRQAAFDVYNQSLNGFGKASQEEITEVKDMRQEIARFGGAVEVNIDPKTGNVTPATDNDGHTDVNADTSTRNQAHYNYEQDVTHEQSDVQHLNNDETHVAGDVKSYQNDKDTVTHDIASRNAASQTKNDEDKLIADEQKVGQDGSSIYLDQAKVDSDIHTRDQDHLTAHNAQQNLERDNQSNHDFRDPAYNHAKSEAAAIGTQDQIDNNAHNAENKASAVSHDWQKFNAQEKIDDTHQSAKGLGSQKSGHKHQSHDASRGHAQQDNDAKDQHDNGASKDVRALENDVNKDISQLGAHYASRLEHVDQEHHQPVNHQEVSALEHVNGSNAGDVYQEFARDVASHDPNKQGVAHFESYQKEFGDVQRDMQGLAHDPNNATDYEDLSHLKSEMDKQVAHGDSLCFASGTRILTPQGERLVETLKAGDMVITSRGEHKAVKWIGYQEMVFAGSLLDKRNSPVCIVKDAISENVPNRDLYVSPAHALAFTATVKGLFGKKRKDILTRAGSLLNGKTIYQVHVPHVKYWHVELDAHDILVANGAKAESFQDRGERSFFVNGQIVQLQQESHMKETAEILPRVKDGRFVRSIRKTLRNRAHHLQTKQENVA